MGKRSRKTSGVPIRNLRDLCRFLGTDRPAGLNRAIYKGTGCGASISVYLPPEGRPARAATWSVTYRVSGRRLRPVSFRRNGRRADALPPEAAEFFDVENGRTSCTLAQALASGREGLCSVRRAGPWLVATKRIEPPAEELRAIHCGQTVDDGEGGTRDAWDIPIGTPIAGFTIQTIVEGSDATVDSAMFSLPVDSAEVDRWIEEMEAEADRLWKRDNLDHYLLRGPDGVPVAMISTGWGETTIDSADLDEAETARVRRFVERLGPDGPDRPIRLRGGLHVLERHHPED